MEMKRLFYYMKGRNKCHRKLCIITKPLKKWREKWEENPVNPRMDDNGNKSKNITVWMCSHIHLEIVFM